MSKFSIIIPVVSINDYVRETVPYIQALTEHEWELFIIPNNVEKNEWPEDERIVVVESGRVGLGDKRDLGAKKASGDILVFLDDDSYPEPNILKFASKHFKNSNILAVGGPGITPPTDSFWQRVSGAVFLSKYTGGSPERYVSVGQARIVDDWPSVNFMVRKEIFLSVGGFDCKYWPGEDTKLCLKLINIGANIIYEPDMVVWHHRRSGFVAHLKQIGAYGLHRGYFARHYPKTSFRLKYFLPSSLFLFVVLSIFSLFIKSQILYQLVIIGLILYAFSLIVGALEIIKFEKILVTFSAILYVIPTHIFYGMRFIEGYFKSGTLNSKLR